MDKPASQQLPDATGTESVDDIIKFFGADDDPNEPNEEVVSELIAANDPETIEKGKNKKEVEEPEKEEVQELKLDDEEIPEAVLPRRQVILKKYPELFKDFPAIEKAMYREQAYTEVFPTVKDAKEAAEVAQEYQKFEDKILTGDLEDLLTSVKKNDNEAFVKIVDGILPTISKIDHQGYLYILGSVLENTIYSMATEGNNQNNDNLKSAAKVLQMFVFGNSEIKNPTQLGKKIKALARPENDSIAQEKAAFFQEKLDNAKTTISGRTENLLRSAVTKIIDPKDSMNAYTKKTAINDVISLIESNIDADSRFKSTIDRLWEKASNSDFSESSLLDIRNTYLARAKTILRQSVDKVRGDALKGLSSRRDKREEVEEEREVRSPRREKEKEEQRPKKRMSTLEFLSQD
jgi:hypothetical protein